MPKSKKSKSKRPKSKIHEPRTYDIFAPVVVKSAVSHRQEVIVVHTVELAKCSPYEEEPLMLWGRWPSIPAELWSRYSRYSGDPLLVVERAGWAPHLVVKSVVDDIHEAPIPSVMDEIAFPIARNGERDEWLVYLAANEVHRDEDLIWGDELIEDVHRVHGGTPYSQSEYVRAMRKVPRVKAILDTFEAGGPVPLPFVRWTYGQSIVLAKTRDLLREAGEGDIDEVIAVETAINGYNNHW